MDEATNWSVTLTGKTVAGQDPQTAWQSAAEMMKLEPDTFRTRILDRVPLTLKAVTQSAALGQHDALINCGADAVALANPSGRYLWLQQDGEVRGPVSEAYVRHAIDSGSLDRQTRACIKGEHTWQTLEAALPLAPLPLHLEDDVPPPAAVAEAKPAAYVDAMRMDAVDVAEPLSRHVHLLPEYAAGMYGGFWMRLAAYLVDSLLISVAFIVVFMFLGLMLPHRSAVDGQPQILPGLIAIALVFSVWLYFPLWESSSKQATPGKLALGLLVTNENGDRIGFWHSFGRFLGKFISGLILNIGYMMAGWTSRKQALHDLMAGTFVVRKHALEAWQQGDSSDQRTAAPPMPAWAIVLVVIGGGFFLLIPILAAIAIPAYQSYLTRAQTTEAIVVTQNAKTAVTNYLLTNGTPPADNRQAGLDSPDQLHGRYVSSVSVVDGAVIASFGGQATPMLRDKHITLTPSLQGRAINWTCASEDIPNQYLPPMCRTQ
ncbi:RDD family protein [Dyella psychrodurans]|nr:RDD family protein [Dyella psychrodurans]